MSYNLKLKDISECDRYIYFEYLEKVIPTGDTFMSCGKYDSAKVFKKREDAEQFKADFDDMDRFVVVNSLIVK